MSHESELKKCVKSTSTANIITATCEELISSETHSSSKQMCFLCSIKLGLTTAITKKSHTIDEEQISACVLLDEY